MISQSTIVEILDTAKKLTRDNAKVMGIFKLSGIDVKEDLSFVSFQGDPGACARNLMSNLSSFPILKVAAKNIFHKAGVTF